MQDETRGPEVGGGKGGQPVDCDGRGVGSVEGLLARPFEPGDVR